jgi:bleomycin hydrolase
MKNAKIASLLFVLSAGSMMFAQDDLINKLKNNQSQNANFQFTTLKDVGATSVKNQGSSGTCWSYSETLSLNLKCREWAKNL